MIAKNLRKDGSYREYLKFAAHHISSNYRLNMDDQNRYVRTVMQKEIESVMPSKVKNYILTGKKKSMLTNSVTVYDTKNLEAELSDIVKREIFLTGRKIMVKVDSVICAGVEDNVYN